MEFYKDKKVLITGHTGFKGSWLCRILVSAGAQVAGYALEPPADANLFDLCDVKDKITHVIGDVRDLASLNALFDSFEPEIVIHMAAQPLVRESYENPVYTYETNVMGTVNLLECVRNHPCVRSCLNVTTDKVYKNNEWEWGYRENEPLDGFDPYSNSKSCSELVTHSYINSFFANSRTAVSTARAGNVIGGGDFARDRIIPDCVRAAEKGEPIILRNPHSTRPYQHVLEPLFAYLMIAQRQYEDIAFAGSYNVGPDECDCVTTGTLADIFCKKWGKDITWQDVSEKNAPHEANFLKLDCSRLKATFGWAPVWRIETAVEMVCDWTKAYLSDESLPDVMDMQISQYLTQSGK